MRCSRTLNSTGLDWLSHVTQNPDSLTPEQQRDILDYTYKLLTDFNHGVPPKGNVAPWWQTSKEGVALLLEKGIEYGMPTGCDMMLVRSYTSMKIIRTCLASKHLGCVYPA
jgi:hypothetical protein